MNMSYPKFRIKRRGDRSHAQIKRGLFAKWQDLSLWWGSLVGDSLTDARVISKWAYSEGCMTYEDALQRIIMAKLQPEIRRMGDYGIAPTFKDGYRHFSLDGRTASYMEGRLLPSSKVPYVDKQVMDRKKFYK